MSDKAEPLAAVLAEMRAAAKSTDLFNGEEVGEPLIRGTKVEEWADRIEAAAERERNAHTNDIHDALYKATGIPGNAAALREALQKLCDCTSCDWACIGRTGFDSLNETCLRCTGRPERDGDCPWIRARAALAAPARNCDRFATADDARRAFESAHSHGIVHNLYTAAFDWLFAPPCVPAPETNPATETEAANEEGGDHA